MSAQSEAEDREAYEQQAEDALAYVDTLGPWVETLRTNRNTTGPGLVALCRLLTDEEDTPPALKAIAARFLETRLYRVDRPRSRGEDPGTSETAAQRALAGITRPGGKIHRVLAAYAARSPFDSGNYPHGYTSREIEFVANVKAAHKRTSELLADGLLEVVQRFDGVDASVAGEGVDLERKGGRVLRITDDGRTELARLNAAAASRKARQELTNERIARRLEKSNAKVAHCGRADHHKRHPWGGPKGRSNVCRGTDRYRRPITE